MGYYGHLRIGESTDSGLAVRIDITDAGVALSDNDETLGTWDADVVSIERVSGDLFELVLGEERFMFMAADRLAFGYEALDRLEQAQAKLGRGLRGRLRRLRTSQPAGEPSDGQPSPPAHEQPVRPSLRIDKQPEKPAAEYHSAAEVFRRGYDSADTAPEDADASPVDSETETHGPRIELPSGRVEARPTDVSRHDVALTALGSLAGAASTNGASNGTSNGSVSGAPATPVTPGAPASGSVEGERHKRRRKARQHEEIRSPRLEEAKMSAPPPPADPWDAGDAPPTGIPQPISHQATPPSQPQPNPAPADSPQPVTPPRPPAPPVQESVAPESAPTVPEPPTPVADAEPQVVIDLTKDTRNRPGLIGRFRRKHEHTYSEDVVSGGIIRRVCSECHHVSIGAS